MPSASRPRWQQVTALVSLSASGAIAGFSFVPGAAADLASPTSLPIHLLALQQAARPAAPDDALLRSAIVNVASYYLRMAKDETPAEMDALVWQNDSIDGADHGETCAAFASLTLELAAQVVGQQSWVTGGTSYPWPLHRWADVRVNPNPASPGVISILQDAEAHHRWHPLGDGYEPLPGDWVMFDGHVEVVTSFAGGVLHTVGGDSLPNFSVNAHEYRGQLDTEGVVGFVNNGELRGTVGQPSPSRRHASAGHRARRHPTAGQAAIPGASAAGSPQPARHPAQPERRPAARASSPLAAQGAAAIPGLPRTAHRQPGRSAIPAATPPAAHSATPPAPSAATPGSTRRPSAVATPPQDADGQQTFIGEVAPGAVAAQRRYGVPAAVTIAQAIDESGWGQSSLAVRDHNLFGIKGTGPAGSDSLPTQEYENGQPVTRTASFRVYHNVAESIDDHGKLLATSGYYGKAMADRQDPNAFAAALTGVYATDPDYGAKLIGLMRRYDLYRYDLAAPAATPHAAKPDDATIPGLPPTAPAPADSTSPPAPSSPAPASPSPSPSAPASPSPSAPASPSPSVPAPTATPGPGHQSDPGRTPAKAMPSTQTVSARRLPGPAKGQARRSTPRKARSDTGQYQQHIPSSVRNAFTTMARVPLMREEPFYRDVASHSGIRWELLAACDWMQCEAQPRYSPVHGEKLGTVNPDGTIYRTKSAALEQCADDMVELARAVYRIDLAAGADLSVRDLANVFAAFRWGGLLKLHHTSAMEFPYSVAGLTAQHINMRWPNIADPNTPDKPGGRFRMPFGAVPIVLSLNYPATV
jgi:flagellum-specific peptidoglycan hydrolase FlgJ